MDAVVIGFSLSSHNGRWLTNVALFLGPIFLYWATSDITISALLPRGYGVCFTARGCHLPVTHLKHDAARVS